MFALNGISQPIKQSEAAASSDINQETPHNNHRHQPLRAVTVVDPCLVKIPLQPTPSDQSESMRQPLAALHQKYDKGFIALATWENLEDTVLYFREQLTLFGEDPDSLPFELNDIKALKPNVMRRFGQWVGILKKDPVDKEAQKRFQAMVKEQAQAILTPLQKLIRQIEDPLALRHTAMAYNETIKLMFHPDRFFEADNRCEKLSLMLLKMMDLIEIGIFHMINAEELGVLEEEPKNHEMTQQHFLPVLAQVSSYLLDPDSNVSFDKALTDIDQLYLQRLGERKLSSEKKKPAELARTEETALYILRALLRIVDQCLKMEAVEQSSLEHIRVPAHILSLPTNPENHSFVDSASQ